MFSADAVFLPGWAVPAACYRAALAPVWPGLTILDPGFFGGDDQFSVAGYEQRVMNGLRPLVAAHSLGTMFALRAAADAPVSPRALILFSPFARFSAADDYSGRSVRDIRAMQLQLRREPKILLDNFIKTVYRPEACPIDWTEAGAPDQAALASGLQCLLEYDVRSYLARVRCPVLLLQGADDAISGDGQAEYLARMLPDAELRIVPDCGHALPLTRPDVCVTAIQKFIDTRKVD